MTSAPRSASWSVAHGPAPNCSTARIGRRRGAASRAGRGGGARHRRIFPDASRRLLGSLLPSRRRSLSMAAIATVDDWTARAAGVDVPRRAFVDGAYVDALSGATFECRSPIDGRLLAEVAACDAADVDRAVAGARAAFDSGRWATAAPKERKRVLLRLAELMLEHRDEL